MTSGLPQRPSARTLSVMLTYRCNAQCEDCGTFSSPHDRSEVRIEDVLSTIAQAKELGFVNVVFTGGEATLRWADLLTAIRFAKSAGFPTRLVTNAQWASEPGQAESAIDDLLLAGLDELNISTGDEHARFVPVVNVVHGAIAAAKRKLSTVVMVEVRHEASIVKADIVAQCEAYSHSEYDLSFISFVESPWMPTDGNRRGHHAPAMSANADNIAARRGCDSVLQTYVLQGNGRLASCCGLGMRRVRELQHGSVQAGTTLVDAISSAESDLIKHALHVLGPEKLLAWASQYDPAIDWEGRYAHRCHACLRLYQDQKVKAVLSKQAMKLLPDVIFGRFVDDAAMPSLFYSNLSGVSDSV
jgi:organic radical activating enzyme